MKPYQAIILSLLCHSILLLPLAEQRLPEVALAPIQVTIGESNQAQPDSFKPVEPATSNTKQPRSADNEQLAAIKDIHNKPTTQKQAEKTYTSVKENVNKKKDTTSQQQAQNYVLSRLHSEIDNYFFYPLLARRNGWQGKVILGLSVNPQGNIRNIHIKEGSGYRVLDQSALNTLLKIKQIKSSGDWIVLDDLDIIIPVIYRLQKG